MFDGIGGWLLAAKHAGIMPVWASEIEPFPAAVTAYHFPDVVQLGDITKIQDLPPVDIVTAGSPCQDLSVAGKREGLQGARSGLFIRAVELVRRLRLSTGGRSPRFFVWENVPGAFSSNKGMDFRAVLEEIGESAIPMPPNGRWANAGLVELPKCQIAWRVLDAQYWGVPQRRRRIFLVADFTGRCAGEILFEQQGLYGDSSESGETREGTSAGTESGVGTASVMRMRQGCAGGGKGPLVSKEKSLTLATANDQTLFVPDKARSLTARNDGSPCVDRGLDIVAAGFKAGQSRAGGLGYEVEKAATLGANMSGTEPTVAVYGVGVDNGIAGTLDASYYKGQGERQGKERTAVAVYENHAQDSRVKEPIKTAPSINAKAGTGGNNLPLVSYAIAGNTIDRQIQNGGNGKGVLEEKSYTLNTIDRHAVYAMQRSDEWKESRVSHTLAARDYKDATGLVYQKSVRRLTPTECERLQGLPDGYTLIDDKTCSDTARYKALGNGMAQPCADYVIRRIVEVCNGKQ